MLQKQQQKQNAKLLNAAKTVTNKISSVNKKRLVTEPLFYLINIVLAAGIRLQSDTKKTKYHFAHVFF